MEPTTTDTGAGPGRNDSFDGQSSMNRNQLGSSHPAVFNVTIGDGSVRGVSKAADPMLLWNLTNAEHSVTAQLP